MRKYPATCKKCGNQVDYPSIRCKECGTRIPYPMGFLSYLMAVLWVFPSLSLIAMYFFIDPSIRMYLCYALFLPALALTYLLLTDKRKAKRDADSQTDSSSQTDLEEKEK